MHCVSIRGRALGALRTAGPLPKSNLPLHFKILLNKKYIWPVMIYAAPGWASFYKSYKKYLLVVKNKVF